MTPTSPEPAECRSLRVAITVKLTSNELTVSPDGTVAAGPDVLLLPHAAVMTAIAPTHAENERRLNFRKCIYGPPDPRGAFLLPSSRAGRGESAPATGLLRSAATTGPIRFAGDRITQGAKFVKRPIWSNA